MMRRIYFDITDIVRYAENNDRVTGIQRVQLRLISCLVTRYGCEYVRGVANFGALRGWQDIDLTYLKGRIDFNAIEFLLAVGRIEASIFPPRALVKRALAKYNGNKVVRAFEKVKIYVRSVVDRKGLASEGHRFFSKKDMARRANNSIKNIPVGSVYVMLGVNVANESVELFARAHKARGGAVVQMIHDLIPYAHPDLHEQRMVVNFNSWLSRTCQYVSLYLCVSRNTANDLEEFLDGKGSDARVIVTPLAHEFAGYARGQVVPVPTQASHVLMGLIDQKFILCVGSIEVRKNGLSLLMAWKEIYARLGADTPKLVFAGRLGWKIEEFREYLKSTGNVFGTVVVVESPTDEDLGWLYSHCEFTAYPSKYEGWGLPVGESAWFDKLCIASSASSIPEVCGELMDYVEPDDIDDLVEKLLRPLLDKAYLLSRNKGISCSQLRAWGDVAEDLLSKIKCLHDVQPDAASA